MRKYETVFVIDSLLKSDEIDDIITKYEKFISANGGQIEIVERWGKRRLAYEIKKRQYGYYVMIRFDGVPAMIKTLEREYRLNESILRYKTIKLDTMALKALEQKQSMAPKVKPEPKETETETREEKPAPAETTEAPATVEESVETPEAEATEETAEAPVADEQDETPEKAED